MGLEKVESPCTRNCCLDENDMCLGCFRILPEIMAWSEADNAQRQHYLANSHARREKFFTKSQGFWR